MKPRIRKATPSDLPLLVEIDSRCFTPDVAFDAAELNWCLSDPGSMTFIAQDGSTVAGFAIVSAGERQGTGNLVTLDVLAPWRRAGLGSALLAASGQWLHDRGIGQMDLQVDVSNEPALAFYLRHGFRKRRKLPAYYGPGKDAYLMSKQL